MNTTTTFHTPTQSILKILGIGLIVCIALLVIGVVGYTALSFRSPDSVAASSLSSSDAVKNEINLTDPNTIEAKRLAHQIESQHLSFEAVTSEHNSEFYIFARNVSNQRIVLSFVKKHRDIPMVKEWVINSPLKVGDQVIVEYRDTPQAEIPMNRPNAYMNFLVLVVK